mmetsp:Transcript_65435/g.182085  ORF Transcript_65435/g.182085 Transcript_65435/m.182085 type:complete len:203 (+) Transcript_65435:426-1034(+)
MASSAVTVPIDAACAIGFCCRSRPSAACVSGLLCRSATPDVTITPPDFARLLQVTADRLRSQVIQEDLMSAQNAHFARATAGPRQSVPRNAAQRLELAAGGAPGAIEHASATTGGAIGLAIRSASGGAGRRSVSLPGWEGPWRNRATFDAAPTISIGPLDCVALQLAADVLPRGLVVEETLSRVPLRDRTLLRGIKPDQGVP